MTNSTALLAEWQYLLIVSHRMLDFALRGEWQTLIDGEVEYVALVEKLSRLPRVRLTPLQQRQLSGLITTLLENEQQVRELLTERMTELRTLIAQGQQQHSLVATYGQLSGRLLVGDVREH